MFVVLFCNEIFFIKYNDRYFLSYVESEPRGASRGRLDTLHQAVRARTEDVWGKLEMWTSGYPNNNNNNIDIGVGSGI